ncbi:MAG: alkane 1-monooxygenase [Solirubrobacteraceae bacterium]|nr:alkane 1-monooxygenase [Solirubrobacteraceae bacterium]
MSATHAGNLDDGVEAIAPDWKDGKRYAWLLGLAVPLIPFAAYLLVELTGLGVFWWFGPAFIFGLMPLMDKIGGDDTSNPPESVIKWLENDHYYRWCTYLFIPIQYAATIFSAWMWSRGTLSTIEAIGLAVSLGCTNGIAIADAHELGHKREALEKWLARIALAPSFYGHFMIEHNRGHHVRVSTPEDPASSRLGESFYRFLPRTVAGSLKSAWHLEATRLRRAGKSPFTLKNDIINAWALSIVLWGGLLIAFGPKIAPYLLLQGVIAFSLLEVVNYIEHYGLLRQKLEDGRYERCQPVHSWNANLVASNVFLYHLQRHSDHHAHPLRRYQVLRHFDDAPILPTGYAGMIVLAIVPPVYFRMMNQRVVDHYGGDVTKANIQPSARKRLMRKYGSGGQGGSSPSSSVPSAA